jgi:hypothetical protein
MIKLRKLYLFPQWYVVEQTYADTMQLNRHVMHEFSDPNGAGPNIREKEHALRRNLSRTYARYMGSRFPRLSGASYQLMKACAAYKAELAWFIPRMTNA